VFVDKRQRQHRQPERSAVKACAHGGGLPSIRPLELRFNVINISDEKYFDAIHPSHVIPGAARTFLLTGTWRF
jgi:hypothetical protein